MDTLGSRLRKSRLSKHLKQTDVAKHLGIEGGTVSGYERNYRDPDTATLAAMAKMYDVTTDYLTSGKERNQNTIMETEQEYVVELFKKISDPVRRQAAIEVLKGFSGEK